jgi:hypothetical protein
VQHLAAFSNEANTLLLHEIFLSRKVVQSSRTFWSNIQMLLMTTLTSASVERALLSLWQILCVNFDTSFYPNLETLACNKRLECLVLVASKLLLALSKFTLSITHDVKS